MTVREIRSHLGETYGTEVSPTLISSVTDAVYLAIGLNLAGEKEVLGLWIAPTEGAKFWLQVVTELKNRGVRSFRSPALMLR